MQPLNNRFATTCILAFVLCVCRSGQLQAESLRLESPTVKVEVDAKTGSWSFIDRLADVRWPSSGLASPGMADGLAGELRADNVTASSIRLVANSGAAVTFALVDHGRSLEMGYEGPQMEEIRLLDDLLTVTADEAGYAVVPCREGLLIPADSRVAFRRVFGTSDYEGCHMNMLAFGKSGAALIVSWDDAYVWPELQSELTPHEANDQRLTATLTLRRSARSIRLTPIGKGDWNAIAAAYRQIAAQKGLAVTLRQKILRNARTERLLGAADVKLWTCLARRMNEQSTQEESVTVHWTFEEAAAIAEHLHEDLEIERCLFMLGGWTNGGYDCRHPDNLPANPECGGNAALADAIERIQRLDYVACLHDNYQDMYRDAQSWDPSFIEKRQDGTLIPGGQWLGGRAYMVCAPKQVELAMRPQNLPATQTLFGPGSYFIDTTFAVGPRECADPNHPLSRNDDISWKIKLSDRARDLFGLFGSECGREWALPHSDFFEGLVGVSGRPFHNLDPVAMGATVIPFWEMVYHDCQICFGKYGYKANDAAAYVAHHVLCARPLHYHSVPNHRYWLRRDTQGRPSAIDPATPHDMKSVRFTRTDNGWAEGLHPHDAFLKNTHEVLGPLHKATAHQRLTQFDFLTPDRTLRRAVYGDGDEAVTVVVNCGAADAEVTTRWGGTITLPCWGFVVESQRFVSFCAKSWNGDQYRDATLFAIESLNGDPLETAAQTRVFHAFGDTRFSWQGNTCDIRREQVITRGD